VINEQRIHKETVMNIAGGQLMDNMTIDPMNNRVQEVTKAEKHPLFRTKEISQKANLFISNLRKNAKEHKKNLKEEGHEVRDSDDDYETEEEEDVTEDVTEEVKEDL
jgi:hypothetical protein